MQNWKHIKNGMPEEKSLGIGYSKGVLVTDYKQVWISHWCKFLNEWSNQEDNIEEWKSIPNPPKRPIIHTKEERDNLDNWVN